MFCVEFKDLCSAMLKKVLRQIEVIRSSRSGEPNFESHEVEANDLQVAVSQYLQVRGTGKVKLHSVYYLIHAHSCECVD